MQIKARKCFVPISPSRWVAKVYLTCDNKIAVEYRHGQHVKKIAPYGPGAYQGTGGVPSACCLYPGTQGDLAETLYELAEVWSYAGEWVHAFLYKKFGYQLVSAPVECGNCKTSCFLELDPSNPADGQTVTIICTIVNEDGSPSKGDAPEGTVDIYIDGTKICSQILPEDDPDSKNYQRVTCQWNATCVGGNTHTVEAVYTPAVSDFAQTSCSATVTVANCLCCPNGEPALLHATISNIKSSSGGGVGGTGTGSAGQPCLAFSGTYPLSYSPGQGLWVYTGSLLEITLQCGAGTNPTWEIGVSCLTDGIVTGRASGGPDSQQCDPFLVTYAGLSLSPCNCCPAGGTFDVTVTT